MLIVTNNNNTKTSMACIGYLWLSIVEQIPTLGHHTISGQLSFCVNVSTLHTYCVLKQYIFILAYSYFHFKYVINSSLLLRNISYLG